MLNQAQLHKKDKDYTKQLIMCMKPVGIYDYEASNKLIGTNNDLDIQASVPEGKFSWPQSVQNSQRGYTLQLYTWNNFTNTFRHSAQVALYIGCQYCETAIGVIINNMLSFFHVCFRVAFEGIETIMDNLDEHLHQCNNMYNTQLCNFTTTHQLLQYSLQHDNIHYSVVCMPHIPLHVSIRIIKYAEIAFTDSVTTKVPSDTVPQ